MRQLCLTTLLLFTAIVETRGEELQGARKAIEAIQGNSEETGGKSQNAFESKFETYQKDLSTLSPEDQAKRWLGFHQDWVDADKNLTMLRLPDGSIEYGSSEAAVLFKALPSPLAWPALAAQIQARPLPGEGKSLIAARGLRLLGSHLIGDQESMKRELDAVDKLVKGDGKTHAGSGKFSTFLGQIFGFDRGPYQSDSQAKLRQAISDLKIRMLTSDPVERFKEELNRRAKNDQSEYYGDYSEEVQVPDLVDLIGKEQAAELLTRAFKVRGISLEFNPHFTETFRLGRDLASKNLKSLKNIPWSLCHSIDANELYEGLCEKFADSKGSWSWKVQESDAYYLRGLVIRKEYEKGIQTINREERFREEMAYILYFWREMPETDRIQEQTWTFLKMVLENRPDLSLGEALTTYSLAAGKQAETLELMDRMIGEAEGDKSKQRALAMVKADAQLAYGDIDSAMQTYLRCLTVDSEENSEQLLKEMGLAVKVSRIGVVLKNESWIDAGIEHFEKCAALSEMGNDAENRIVSEFEFESNLATMIEILLATNRLEKAEKLLINCLSNQERRDANQSSTGDNTPGVLLVRVYEKAGRFEDVILLLDELKALVKKDLSDHIQRYEGGALAMSACIAFSKLGKQEIARKIAERLVIVFPGRDAGWEMLSELAGDDFPAIAERVFQRDQFEERPLIWLADYQLKKSQIEEAEKTIRKAISIDPSDGEQGKGDRMRAYSVLARVLEAKKDPQAEVFRGAVEAIRIAEDADQFREAGLLSRAIDLYRESLTHFADAYCIQSRLAVQLAEAGDLEAAAKHYQRAFELMPDSFGRVESHCFGCEGVFGGELASSIATKVFEELSRNRPNDPKVHYLTGYLAKSQDDYERALAEFSLATKLDPDYLNAWSELNSLQENMSIPQKILDESRLSMYRLAPLRDEGTRDLKAVLDLKGLWEVASEVSQRIPRIESEPLYPLGRGNHPEGNPGDEVENPFEYSGSEVDFFGFEIDGPRSVDELLAENEFLLAIGTLLEADRRRD